MNIFDEYEALFDNYSEADAIIEKANDDLLSLLSDRVKTALDKAKEAEGKLQKLQMQIASAEVQRDTVNRELEEARQKAETAEIQEIPGKYIANYVRTQTGGFAPGDTVFIVTSNNRNERCSLCKGNGRVDATISGETFRIICPSCRGQGTTRIPTYEVKKRKVDNIRLQLGFRGGRVSYWECASLGLEGESFSRRVDDVYLTEELANEELKRRGAQAK